MEETIKIFTGHGHWSPLIWVAAALGTFSVALLLWLLGRREHKRGTDQEIPFLSGERMEEPRVSALHLYWGFAEALKPILTRLKTWHSGVVNDYAGWFLLILAVVFLLVIV
ncbi:MAG: hydrogenase [Candidatus Bipolaricaulota bacterium]|nr:hydrogenase [Candidatus Bipolaricaulota bacterium]MDW8127018.1 hydrogenase [Candidatus Bipolaricaulota bacterium]